MIPPAPALHNAMDEASQDVRFDVRGAVAIITMDRPGVLNALHPAGHRAMSAAFDRFRDDPDLQVAIVTGAGDRAFCVGTDLKALAETGDHAKPATGFAGITHRQDLFKPVIAAVNGACLGGGMEILAACDLAVAAENASFGLPEPRVGLAALGGGLLQRLPRQLPAKQASWLILTAQSVGAEAALRMALVNEVVPTGRALERSLALAQTLLECAPLALQASKQVMLQSQAVPDLFEAMRAGYPLADRMLASRDAIEGPRAFAEKRKPRWTGR